MYVVVTEDLVEVADLEPSAVGTLEQAFAQVCCWAGYGYHFEQEQDGWRLVITDIERPECSPEPIRSTYIKRADAHRDLIAQAVDGRLKGYAAVMLSDLKRQSDQATKLQAAQ